LFGGDIIRIITGHGELTIETDDPNVKIELLENGKKVRIIDTMTDKKIDIKEGKYTLQVAGEENTVQVTPTDLTISRGGKEIVRVNSTPLVVEAYAPAELADASARTLRKRVSENREFEWVEEPTYAQRKRG